MNNCTRLARAFNVNNAPFKADSQVFAGVERSDERAKMLLVSREPAEQVGNEVARSALVRQRLVISPLADPAKLFAHRNFPVGHCGLLNKNAIESIA